MCTPLGKGVCATESEDGACRGREGRKARSEQGRGLWNARLPRGGDPGPSQESHHPEAARPQVSGLEKTHLRATVSSLAPAVAGPDVFSPEVTTLTVPGGRESLGTVPRRLQGRAHAPLPRHGLHTSWLLLKSRDEATFGRGSDGPRDETLLRAACPASSER